VRTNIALVGAVVLTACDPAPRFIGSATCAGCHEDQARAWRDSDHARAMSPATDSAVRGDFGLRVLVSYGDSVRFDHAGGQPTVTLAGADGRRAAFLVAYTFGSDPLQQYLVEFPRGRYQALPFAWDTRPTEAGGGRWIHMYPTEPIRAGDDLFWTGPAQNWNTMCAECHSTDLRKNYVAAADSFATSWAEINVACEACHGPGSLHASGPRRSLGVQLDERAGTSWSWDSVRARPRRSRPPPLFRAEVETCGRCHARRAQVWGDYVAGRPLLDTHRPSLLEPGLYFADGQMDGEVYEYGSFLQSRMFRAGVTCSDCHDPHSGGLRATGNAVCTGCHVATRYDGQLHHHHSPEAASCVDCHMAPRTYMVVDVRRDHSMRVPRPEVAGRVGAPDACSTCHTDRGPSWAAVAIARWYGAGRSGGPQFAEAFALQRRGQPSAEEALADVIADSATASWVRASALAALGAVLTARGLDAVAPWLDDPDPLVRFGALAALEGVPPASRVALVAPRLEDSVRVLRMDAAALLAPAPRERLSADERRAFERAIAEYRTSQAFNAEQPWAHVNLGLLAADLGDAAGAETAYRAALRADSGFIPAYVNLADLYRALGRDEEGEPLLRRAIAIAPTAAPAHYALGLLLVRRGRKGEALDALRRAAALAPDDPRFAVALRAAEAAR
jgi:predicted CXXCH cytochrome family protein